MAQDTSTDDRVEASGTLDSTTAGQLSESAPKPDKKTGKAKAAPAVIDHFRIVRGQRRILYRKGATVPVRHQVLEWVEAELVGHVWQPKKGAKPKAPR